VQYRALGSIGCAALSLTIVREQVTTLRQATNRPFNLNFFAPAHPRIDPQATARVRAELAPYFEEFGLGPVPEPKEPFATFDEERLDLILELKPRVVSFHFGLPATSAGEGGSRKLAASFSARRRQSTKPVRSKQTALTSLLRKDLKPAGIAAASAAVRDPAWSVRWRSCPKLLMRCAYR